MDNADARPQNVKPAVSRYADPKAGHPTSRRNESSLLHLARAPGRRDPTGELDVQR